MKPRWWLPWWVRWRTWRTSRGDLLRLTRERRQMFIADERR